MTKLRISAIFILCITICSCNPWTLDPITELVCLQKSEYYIDSLDNEIAKKEIHHDENHNPIKEEYFEFTNNDYHLIKEIFTEYDDSNNPIAIRCLENGILTYRCSKEWDEQGKIILVEYFNENDELENRTSYSYDQLHHLIEVSIWSQPNTFIVFKYENNAAGDPTKKTTLDGSNGQVLRIEIISYNAQGQRIRVDLLSSEEELFSYEIYEYNEYGDLIRLASYNADGDLQYEQEFQRLYDAMGNQVDNTTYYNGLFNIRRVYKYDEYNNIVKLQHLNEAGEIQFKIDYNFECKDVIIH